MNNVFSLEQVTKTGGLNADLIMRQYMLNNKAKFMEMKSRNPKLKQSKIAKELAISTSTLQRYRRKLNMHSPYRKIQSSNTHTRKPKIPNHTEHDVKTTSNDLKMTSNDLKEISKESVKYSKNKLKVGNPNDKDNPTQGSILVEQAFSYN